jgi:tRNA (guanine-N7-)-methyltransferase
VRKPRRLPPEALQPYLLPFPDPPAPLDWRAVFGNDRPVELEVGFGKGLFLLTAAQARPDVNFAGVEIDRKYQLFTATRIAKRGLANVRVACGDGRLFVAACVAPGSLRAVHVYFPDPWWKKRHQKRRLFTAEFAAAGARALALGGQFHVATDVADYAAVIAALLDARPELVRRPPPEPAAAAHDMDYLTNFERKFRKEGRPIYRMLYERAAPGGTP